MKVVVVVMVVTTDLVGIYGAEMIEGFDIVRLEVVASGEGAVTTILGRLEIAARWRSI